jgi:hypothetical protein
MWHPGFDIDHVYETAKFVGVEIDPDNSAYAKIT